MTKKELVKLKKLLPAGYIETIATRTEFSTGYVSMVLNGQRNNLEIIKAAVSMAEDYSKEMSHLSDKIKNL